MLFDLEMHKHAVNGIQINCRVTGQGPALLLLHGHSQTHVMWHKVAPELAKHYMLVMPDLRGYGDSDKPVSPISPAQRSMYSNRIMAQDVCELMHQLGYPQFYVLAHDRGARVAHRLALDHPDVVKRMILLDIAPTLAMYSQTNEAFARAYWHWFLLIRPTPFPETLISADPAGYLRGVMGVRSAGMKPFTEQALAEYTRALSLPGTAYGICEDYRASASIDLEHDAEDIAQKHFVECPLLVLWGQHGAIEQCFSALAEWEKVALDVKGYALPSGHYIAEEIPERLLEEVYGFLGCENDK